MTTRPYTTADLLRPPWPRNPQVDEERNRARVAELEQARAEQERKRHIAERFKKLDAATADGIEEALATVARGDRYLPYSTGLRRHLTRSVERMRAMVASWADQDSDYDPADYLTDSNIAGLKRVVEGIALDFAATHGKSKWPRTEL